MNWRLVEAVTSPLYCATGEKTFKKVERQRLKVAKFQKQQSTITKMYMVISSHSHLHLSKNQNVKLYLMATVHIQPFPLY